MMRLDYDLDLKYKISIQRTHSVGHEKRGIIDASDKYCRNKL